VNIVKFLVDNQLPGLRNANTSLMSGLAGATHTEIWKHEPQRLRRRMNVEAGLKAGDRLIELR
jgi:hypothetical protein